MRSLRIKTAFGLRWGFEKAMDSESDVKTAMDSESDVEVAYEPHWHNPKDCTAIVTADFFQKALLAKEERKMLRKLQDMKKALRFFEKKKI